MNEKQKYVCPNCGGNLTYYSTSSVIKKQEIDPETGACLPEITKSNFDATEVSGFNCEQCGADTNDISITIDGNTQNLRDNEEFIYSVEI